MRSFCQGLFLLLTLGTSSCHTPKDSRSQALHQDAVEKALAFLSISPRFNENYPSLPKVRKEGILYRWEETPRPELAGFEVLELVLTTEKKRAQASRSFLVYKTKDELSLLHIYQLSRILYPEHCLAHEANLPELLRPFRLGESVDSVLPKERYNLAYLGVLRGEPLEEEEGGEEDPPPGFQLRKNAGLCLHNTVAEVLLDENTSPLPWR